MRHFTLSLMCALLATPAWAAPELSYKADWQKIAADRRGRIEVDFNSVQQPEPGIKTAWGRIVLNDEEARTTGYGVIKALNRYDCRNQKFSTLRRVYLSTDFRIVRQEEVGDSLPQTAVSGSLDSKLLSEACNRPQGDAFRTVAAATEEKHADPAPTQRRKPEEDPKAAAVDPRIKLLKQGQMDGKPLAEKGSETGANSGGNSAGNHLAPPPEKIEPPRSTYYTYRPAVAPRRAVKPKATIPAVAYQPHVHWGYEGEGAPDNWGKLRSDYTLCNTGTRQSPIDLHDGLKLDLEPIKIDYKPSYFRIIDNGHTVQVNFGQGNTITIMGKEYDLTQFHFHRPSEERIRGRGFDMVMHLVHKNMDNQLAVIALLMERSTQANPIVQTVWNNLPLEKGVEYDPEVILDLSSLIQDNKNYYIYMGSLTTPPCTEGVTWVVMKNTLQVSSEQINAFSRLYRNNARPIQPSNGRLIKESR